MGLSILLLVADGVALEDIAEACPVEAVTEISRENPTDPTGTRIMYVEFPDSSNPPRYRLGERMNNERPREYPHTWVSECPECLEEWQWEEHGAPLKRARGMFGPLAAFEILKGDWDSALAVVRAVASAMPVLIEFDDGIPGTYGDGPEILSLLDTEWRPWLDVGSSGENAGDDRKGFLGRLFGRR